MTVAKIPLDLVPTLLRGNEKAGMHSHAGAWERETQERGNEKFLKNPPFVKGDLRGFYCVRSSNSFELHPKQTT